MDSQMNYQVLWVSVWVGLFCWLLFNTKLTENSSQKSFLSNMVYSSLQTTTAFMGPIGIYGEQSIKQSFLLYPGPILFCVEDNSFWPLDKLSIENEGILLIQLLSLPCREFFLDHPDDLPITFRAFFPHIVTLDSKSFSVLILVLLEGSSLLSGGQLILQISIFPQTSRDIVVIIGSFWQSSH